MLVGDKPPAGGDGRRDPGFGLIMGNGDIDVNPVAPAAGDLHLLEPQARSAPLRVHEVLLAVHSVPEELAPERHHILTDCGVDGDVDLLHGRGIWRHVQNAGSGRDLASQLDVTNAESAGLVGHEADGDPVVTQIDVGVVIGGIGQVADGRHEGHPVAKGIGAKEGAGPAVQDTPIIEAIGLVELAGIESLDHGSECTAILSMFSRTTVPDRGPEDQEPERVCMSSDAPTRQPFAQAPPALPRRSASPALINGRMVVAVVVTAVILITGFVFTVGLYFAGTQQPKPPTEIQVGPVDPLVSEEIPPEQLLLLAVAFIAAIGIIAITFEAISALMTTNPRRSLLSKYRPTVAPGTPGHVTITVLVPAHNEEFSLPATLMALDEQTRSPDRVVVVADNCTDGTVAVARELGHETFETVNNFHRKGGALNQALSHLLPTMGAGDVILVMDADTRLGPHYLEVAAKRMEQDPELTSVGGVFYGEDGHGLIGQFQRNEYTRYSLQIRARHGRVFVLTGTASMFRAEALLDVAAARGVFIPGESGKVYDTAALTEDNELTLALKSLGATMTSPPECLVTTEIMPTWRNLWVQRQRWQRGALENLSAYGLTRATLRYWGQQVGIGFGTVALNLAIVLMAITLVAVNEWVWFPFWVIVGLIFVAERVITVWKGGWKARLLAAVMLPEIAYDMFLQVVFVKCLIDITIGRSPTWGHVQHAQAEGGRA